MATAWVMERPGVLRQATFPETPIGSHEIVIKVRAVGVCGTDRHLYLGHGSFPFPLIGGHEIVGEVTEVGATAEEETVIWGGPIEVGRWVVVVPSSAPCGRCFYCINYPHRTTLCRNRFVYGFRRCDQPPHLFGGFAEYVRIQARSFLFLLPDDFPMERAVLTEPTAVALRAVERAFSPGLPIIGEGLGVGRRGLVIGAGPIGLLVTAVLRTMGMHKILVADISAQRLELAQRIGAHLLIEATGDVPTVVQKIRQETDGEGADIVWECAGSPKAFSLSLDAVCRGGTVIEVGHFTDSGPVDLRPHQVCHKDLDIRGVWAYPWWQFRDAIRFLQTCPLPLSDLISHRIGLAELPRALAGELTGPTVKPVVVID